MRCLDGGSALANRNNGMIDKTDMEQKAIRAAEAGELPPRIAASPDFYLCRWCAYAQRCWEGVR